MKYAYLIFGILYRNEEEIKQMSDESSHLFDGIDGLISRHLFSNIEDQMASALFFCEDLESAEMVKEKMHVIIEKYDEYIDYTTEFIYKVIETVKYK
jgi:hypothetical protein